MKPLAAFVGASVPGTTRWHAHELATALQLARLETSSFSKLLLAAHSPATAFEARDDQSRPGDQPAAAVVPDLVIAFIPRVSSLEGVIPQAFAACAPFRCAILSSGDCTADFWGQN